MLSSHFNKIGISALLAGAAISTVLLQASPAASKEYDKSTPKLMECVAVQAEVDQMLVSISEQIAALQARCDSMAALAVEADAELQQISQDGSKLIEDCDDAERVFDEQVASLLDAETVAAVKSSLQQLRATATFSDGSSSDVTMTESVQPVNEKLDELLATLEALKQLSKEIKKTGEGKKEYTGHVSLIK
ncbi:hypothetical protein IT575_11300 [bacterium]|nr:hypothetical protein [bacterium]